MPSWYAQIEDLDLAEAVARALLARSRAVAKGAMGVPSAAAAIRRGDRLVDSVRVRRAKGGAAFQAIAKGELAYRRAADLTFLAGDHLLDQARRKSAGWVARQVAASPRLITYAFDGKSWGASTLAFPGAYGQGRTREEAYASLISAVRDLAKAYRKDERRKARPSSWGRSNAWWARRSARIARNSRKALVEGLPLLQRAVDAGNDWIASRVFTIIDDVGYDGDLLDFRKELRRLKRELARDTPAPGGRRGKNK